MKLRNIKTTLENINEAIKYVVFAFTLILIASFALFIAYVYQNFGEIFASTVIDVVIVVVLLGLTISSKGSVSIRRTTLMIIFGLFNLYGALNYAFFYSYIFVDSIGLGQITQILLYIGVASSIINVLCLIFRAIILVQYDICVNEGIDQLNKENFKYSFNKAVRGLGVGIPTLFLYAMIYLGFSLMLSVFMDLFDTQILILEYLILGLILLIIPVLFMTLIRRYSKSEEQKYLGFAAFFAFILLGSMVSIITLDILYPGSSIIIELGYLLGIGALGFGYSLYLILLKK